MALLPREPVAPADAAASWAAIGAGVHDDYRDLEQSIAVVAAALGQGWRPPVVDDELAARRCGYLLDVIRWIGIGAGLEAERRALARRARGPSPPVAFYACESPRAPCDAVAATWGLSSGVILRRLHQLLTTGAC